MSSPFIQRLSGQDTVMLVRVAAAISLMAASTREYSYNFPLFLFGLVSFELPSTSCLQFFLSIVLFSGIFDVINFLFGLRGAGLIFGIILALIKVPIYFSGLGSLRERGGELAWASQGFGGFANFGPWGSQGGLPTTSGGQVHASAPASEPAPPGYFPSGGYRLGGEDDQGQGTPQGGGGRTTRGGYEAIA